MQVFPPATAVSIDVYFCLPPLVQLQEIPNIDFRLLENLLKLGLSQLTPIQRHAIGIMSLEDSVPVANSPAPPPRSSVSRDERGEEAEDGDGDGVESQLERATGKYDLMAAAQTGSGKTLAYLVPIVNRMLRHYPYEAMQTLVRGWLLGCVCVCVYLYFCVRSSSLLWVNRLRVYNTRLHYP